MIKPVSLLLLAAVLCGSCGSRTGRTAATSCDEPSARPSEYVSTLVGTHSDFTLSTGNTYPAVALPWGMNFWTPQTGEMGSGWAYTYGAHTIRGLKQTHQPSPWINDYGQFSIMPIRGRDKVDEESRQSWFSHQSEEARPYYYSVYLADHDIKAEIAPTERAAIMRFTFPESDESGVVIDAFDRGSYIRVMHDKRTVVGYTTRNSGGVPDNFKNWFIVRFDRKIRDFQIYDGTKPVEGEQLVGEHALVRVGFETRRGEQVTVRAASSFISQMQAVQNLEELGKDDFETVKAKAQAHWDEVLGRIEVEGGTTTSTARSIRASTVRPCSRASSTRSTRTAISCITAPTTVRYCRDTCIPTRDSGTPSAVCSHCSIWSIRRSMPKFRPGWQTLTARADFCPNGLRPDTVGAWSETTRRRSFRMPS